MLSFYRVTMSSTGVFEVGDSRTLRMTTQSWYTKNGLNGPMKTGDWNKVKYAISYIKGEAEKQRMWVTNKTKVTLKVNRVPGEEDHEVGCYRVSGIVRNSMGRPDSMVLVWAGGEEGPDVPSFAYNINAYDIEEKHN